MKRQGLNPAKPVAYFEYDFSRDGGAVGEIALRGNSLPDGARVTSGLIEVEAAITSDGAVTVELGVEATADVLASTLKAALTKGTLLDTVPNHTAAKVIKVDSAGAGVVMTVGVAAITAGKLIVALEYYA